MIVNHPVLFLFTLWHRTTVKLYYIKRLGKINLMPLYCTSLTVIPYNTNPLFRII